MRRQYYIIYEKDGRGYIASAPAIPGCAVYGKTFSEAHRNISAAIKECLEVRREFHKKPPYEPMKPEITRSFSFVNVPEYAEA